MCSSTFTAGRSEGHFPNASSIQVGIACAAAMTGVIDTTATGTGRLCVVVAVVIVIAVLAIAIAIAISTNETDETFVAILVVLL